MTVTTMKMETKIQQAFSALDDIDHEKDDIKGRAKTQYNMLENEGIPKPVANLARKVAMLTDIERRVFDAALTLARHELGVPAQLEFDLASTMAHDEAAAQLM